MDADNARPIARVYLPVPGTFRVLLYPANRTENFPPITWETISVDAFTLRKLCQDDKGASGSQFF
jgi:hypothetical protein